MPEDSSGCAKSCNDSFGEKVQSRRVSSFNRHGVWAIYLYELIRFKRTFWQSLVTPVITTSLYFVVFGAAIGARMSEVDGVSYGAFIVPGLMLLAVLTESLTTAAFSSYMPKFIGTIYEILSAPLSSLEIVFAYVGATASKAIILAIIILLTSTLFVPLQIQHPLWMVSFLLLTAAGAAFNVTTSAISETVVVV